MIVSKQPTEPTLTLEVTELQFVISKATNNEVDITRTNNQEVIEK